MAWHNEKITMEKEMQEKLIMLIVDDVEVNRASMRSMFEQEYDVLEAENGQQAVDILKAGSVDVVILDVCMPVMGGAGVLAKMKADAALRDIPVIVKTSIDENMEAAMLEKGADDFIFFPCEPIIIQNRIRNIAQKYVLGKLVLQEKLAAEQHVRRVRERFIARVAAEITEDAKSIMEICAMGEAGENIHPRDAFEQINARSEHLLKMVDGVLADTGFDQEKDAEKSVPFRVQEIADEVEREYRTLCRGKGIDFGMEICGGMGEYLVGDLRCLKQIWERVLDKAYYNTSAGGSIRTACVQRRLGKRQMELTITVYGQIDPDDRYPIVKSIIELLRGTMVLEKTAEEKVLSVIRLPFYIGKQPVSQKKRLDCVRALILDDDGLTRDYHASMLTRLGVSCDVAPSPADAATRLKRADAEGRGYDICFVNWYMVGGSDFIRELRQSYPPEELVISCSTNEKEQKKREMEEAGVDYVLERPLYQSTLYHFLTHICNSENQNPA